MKILYIHYIIRNVPIAMETKNANDIYTRIFAQCPGIYANIERARKYHIIFFWLSNFFCARKLSLCEVKRYMFFCEPQSRILFTGTKAFDFVRLLQFAFFSAQEKSSPSIYVCIFVFILIHNVISTLFAFNVCYLRTVNIYLFLDTI